MKFKELYNKVKTEVEIVTAILLILGFVYRNARIARDEVKGFNKRIEVMMGAIQADQSFVYSGSLEKEPISKVVIMKVRNKEPIIYYAYVSDGISAPYQALWDGDLKQFYFYDFDGKKIYVK